MPPKYSFYFLDIEVLHVAYFANFQSVTDYCIIFMGNSTSASHIFLLQKIVRIMVGVTSRCICKGLFRELEILTFPCLYTFLLMLFVLNHFNNCPTNSSVREINTRYKNQLHRPVVTLTCYQRGGYIILG